MKSLFFGVDELIKSKEVFTLLKFGLVTNDSAVTTEAVKSRIAILEAGLQIIKLFSPEHGINREGDDGAFQEDGCDQVTGLPIISLYGTDLIIKTSDLEDVDAMLFDIPDVGCRFYTYLWTMTNVMESCLANNKLFIILDRPNPLGGNIKKAEGPVLNEGVCSSFIGRWAIPVTHYCTFGELANYFWKTRMPQLQCEIIKLSNWDRSAADNSSTWKFVPTSPAIKDLETVLLYPGLGLLEGINVNEGRGTDKDFKCFGAPWIDANELLQRFKKLNIPGLKAETIIYTPQWGLYKNEKCSGLKLSVTNAENFFPVDTGIKIIKLLLHLFPQHCKERLYKTNANPTGTKHLDKLLGLENAFNKLKNEDDMHTNLTPEEWANIISPYLLY